MDEPWLRACKFFASPTTQKKHHPYLFRTATIDKTDKQSKVMLAHHNCFNKQYQNWQQQSRKTTIDSQPPPSHTLTNFDFQTFLNSNFKVLVRHVTSILSLCTEKMNGMIWHVLCVSKKPLLLLLLLTRCLPTRCSSHTVFSQQHRADYFPVAIFTHTRTLGLLWIFFFCIWWGKSWMKWSTTRGGQVNHYEVGRPLHYAHSQTFDEWTGARKRARIDVVYVIGN